MMTRFAAGAALWTAALSIGAQDILEPIDPWSGAKPGASVKLKTTWEVEGQGKKQTGDAGISTRTLKSLSDTEFEVETTYTSSGLTQTIKRLRDVSGTYVGIYPGSDAGGKREQTRRGEEEITVGKRKFKCAVWSVKVSCRRGGAPRG